MGFALAVGAIMVFGSLAVFLARDAKANFTGEQPRTGGVDRWVSVYNVYDCDRYTNPAWPNAKGTTDLGIGVDGTNLDAGLIVVSPISEKAAGSKARFGLFADRVGLELTPTSVTLPDGTTYRNGEKCTTTKGGSKSSRKAVVKLFVWPPQANKNVKPDVIDTAEIANARFTADGQIFVLAFVPEGTDKITFPTSAIETLRQAKSSSKDPFANQSTTAPATTAPSETAPVPPTGGSDTSASSTAPSAGQK